jgi:hypothetical protein
MIFLLFLLSVGTLSAIVSVEKARERKNRTRDQGEGDRAAGTEDILALMKAVGPARDSQIVDSSEINDGKLVPVSQEARVPRE